MQRRASERTARVTGGWSVTRAGTGVNESETDSVIRTREGTTGRTDMEKGVRGKPGARREKSSKNGKLFRRRSFRFVGGFMNKIMRTLGTLSHFGGGIRRREAGDGSVTSGSTGPRRGEAVLVYYGTSTRGLGGRTTGTPAS
ncbi:unnamed protein product [Boreogadus saida]